MTVTVSDSGILFADGSLQPTALTTGTQTIAGAKTFSSAITASAGIISSGGIQGTLTLATAQNTTSGTAIDFTGIPSWVKRITVMFNGVSTSGASLMQIQIGAGSLLTSGYTSQWCMVGVGTGNGTNSTGFAVANTAGTEVKQGLLTISTLGGNIWVYGGNLMQGAGYLSCHAGQVSLGGTLDRLRLTTVNGTDTFDAGSVNIMYEG